MFSYCVNDCATSSGRKLHAAWRNELCPRCIKEKEAFETAICKVCGGPVSGRNQIGICRVNKRCRRAAKKEHDHRYHVSHRSERGSRPRDDTPRPHRQTITLPEDGIIDEVAIYIAVNGLRKIAMTHRERVEAVRRLLLQGGSIREMCDNLHVQPKIIREILDGLGFECVRNEHIAGSRIMIILPKDRKRGPKILEQGK